MQYLLFGGGLYLVLIGITLLIYPKRNPVNLYFSSVYISTGFIVLYAWAEKTGIIYDYFLFYNMQIPLCYLFPPLMFFGFSQITEVDRKPFKIVSPYFLPFLILVPAVLVTNIINASVFASLSDNVTPQLLQSHPSFLFIHILGLGSNLYILYFLSRIIIAGIRFVRKVNYETVKELGLLLVFVVIFFGVIILMLVAHILHNQDLVYVAKFLSAATFISYSFYSFRYPEYAQKIVRKTTHLRYKNTQVRGLNKDEVLARLSYLMEKEKIFCDLELTLSSLSSQLMLTSHQLSEIMNDSLHMNFSSFLNHHRIEEAKRLLINDPDNTILEIAFEVGYNSKTSFNNNFRHLSGMTPSEFRDSHFADKKRGSGK